EANDVASVDRDDRRNVLFDLSPAPSCDTGPGNRSAAADPEHAVCKSDHHRHERDGPNPTRHLRRVLSIHRTPLHAAGLATARLGHAFRRKSTDRWEISLVS